MEGDFRTKQYAVNQPAMTYKDWVDYCDRNGHPPTWHPHEDLHYKNTKDD